jgi:hypothetical protein
MTVCPKMRIMAAHASAFDMHGPRRRTVQASRLAVTA